MVAMEPEEIKKLFSEIKRISEIRGEARDEVAPSEAYRREHLRRSIALNRKVLAGEQITEDCLTMLRPSGGITWADRISVVGRTAKRDLPSRHRITPDDVM